MMILLTGILISLVLYPTINTLLVSLTDDQELSFHHYLYLFTSEGSLEAMMNTLWLGLLTVVICGGIGTFLAFFVHFFDFPFKRLLDKLLLLPLVIPGVIIVFAFIQLYGESGMITKSVEEALRLDAIPWSFSGLSGILMVHAYTQYIYFYMNVSVAIKQLDRSTIEASLNLGASVFGTFRTVILPYIRTALIASAMLTFMTGIGSFAAPNIIGGYRVLTTQVLMSKANLFMNLAAAQVMILAFFAVTFYFLARHYEQKSQFQGAVKAVPIKPVHIKSTPLKLIVSFFGLLTATMISLPILTIVILSFVQPGTWMIDIYPSAFSLENYERIFTDRRSFIPFFNSLQMALTAAVTATILALPSAYLMTRSKVKGRSFLEFLILLPFALPASAVAINLINAYNSALIGTWVILPLAYTISMLPIAVRSIAVSFGRLSETYAQASDNLGAKASQTFMNITLPLIAPGVWAGFMLMFIASLGEYTLSAFLYNAGNRPVSIAMISHMYHFEIGMSMAYGSLILFGALAGILMIAMLQRKIHG